MTMAKGNVMTAIGFVYSDSTCTDAGIMTTFAAPLDVCRETDGVYTKMVCTTDTSSRKLLGPASDCLTYPKRCYAHVYATDADCQNEDNEIDLYNLGKPDLECRKASHTNQALTPSFRGLEYGATRLGDASSPTYAVIGLAHDNKKCNGNGTPFIKPIDSCYQENGAYVRISC